MKYDTKKISLAAGEYVIASETSLENFSVSGQYRDFEGESNDGMRKGYSYTVRYTDRFRFELLENTDSYIYKLSVTGSNQYGDASPVAGYHTVWREMRRKGAVILAPKGCVEASVLGVNTVYVNAPSRDGEIGLGYMTRLREGEETISYEALVELLTGPIGEIARSVKDTRFFDKDRLVDPNTLPTEDAGLRVEWRKDKGLDELLADGVVTEDDVVSYLDAFIEKAYEPDALAPFLERVPAAAEKVIETSITLPIKRSICPDKVDWGYVISKGWALPGDLDAIVAAGRRMSSVPDAFLEAMAADRAFEKKVAENAMLIFEGHAYGDPMEKVVAAMRPEARKLLVVETAKKCRPYLIDIASYCVKDAIIELSPDELDLVLSVLAERKETSERCAKCIVRLMAAAGHKEDEILDTAISVAGKFNVDGSWMKSTYEELGLSKGLARIEASRLAAEKARAEAKAKRHAESKAVVEAVQAKGGFAKAESGQISALLPEDEDKLFIIEGRRADYLLSVAKAKRARGGILHIDVDEEDAGWIIGPKGAKIKETTEKLNELGCNLRMIKLHAR